MARSDGPIGWPDGLIGWPDGQIGSLDRIARSGLAVGSRSGSLQLAFAITGILKRAVRSSLTAFAPPRTLLAMRNPAALLALVLVSASLPSLASAQRNDGARFSAYFALGAGGEADIESDGPFGLGDFEADLDATLGFGLRFEKPIASIVSLGGLFEMGGYKFDDVDRDADLYFDFDVYAKIGPRLDINNDLDLEVYGLLPFGFTIFRPDGGDDDAMFGLNFGFGGGAALYVGSFGFFAEIGMRHRRVYDEQNNTDIRLATTQAMLNFGGTIVF
jgi:hypothetical protein